MSDLDVKVSFSNLQESENPKIEDDFNSKIDSLISRLLNVCIAGRLTTQVVQDGYEFFTGRRLVTLFSAPHYCGEYNNDAATLAVAEDLSCSFSIFHSVPLIKPMVPVGNDNKLI